MRSARQVVPRSPEQGSQGDGKRTDLQQHQGKQEERARDGNVGNSRKLAGDNKENPQPQDDHLRYCKKRRRCTPEGQNRYTHGNDKANFKQSNHKRSAMDQSLAFCWGGIWKFAVTTVSCEEGSALGPYWP